MNVEMKVKGLVFDPESKMFVVVLSDLENTKALPIWIGPFEGHSIAACLLDRTFKRPLTYAFVADLLQASSVKGKLRAEAYARVDDSDKPKLKAVFGPESGEGASEHAGAISPGDARLLLFPVRALAGVKEGESNGRR